MKDFLGHPIVAGDWLAKGGKGNTAAEYGMILHRVLSVVDGKISTERLSIIYPKHKEPGDVTVRKVTITNPNSVVRVAVDHEMVQLFDAARMNVLTDEARILVGNWLHGAEHVRPWK